LAPKIERDLPFAGFEAEINMAEQFSLSIGASFWITWDASFPIKDSLLIGNPLKFEETCFPTKWFC